jgi:predicted ATP-grasp superfamily ATP-dependent carboligase
MGSTLMALWVGLRSSPLEWQPEITAGTEAGYLVHVASESPLEYTGLPPAQTSSFTWTGAVDSTAAKIIDSIPMRPHIVACWGDRYVGVTARLADHFGISGVGVEAARICNDKAAQRHVLQPFGLNPPWYAGTTLAELEQAVRDLRLPLVFKLRHASGGRGTTLIDKDTDLACLFGKTTLNYVPSTGFVVEEYVDGTEHSAAGLISDGVPLVYAIADKHLDNGRGRLQATTTIVPSALSSDQRALLVATAERAVIAAGLVTGGFHVDMRLTKEGHPIVLEIGARLGGDLINSHLVPIATGNALMPYGSLLDVLRSGVLPTVPMWTAAAAFASRAERGS